MLEIIFESLKESE